MIIDNNQQANNRSMEQSTVKQPVKNSQTKAEATSLAGLFMKVNKNK